MVGTVQEMVDCRKWMPFPEMRRLDHYQDGTESVAGNGVPDSGDIHFQFWLGALPETSWPMPAMVHFLHGARTLPEMTRPKLAMVHFLHGAITLPETTGSMLARVHSLYYKRRGATAVLLGYVKSRVLQAGVTCIGVGITSPQPQ